MSKGINVSDSGGKLKASDLSATARAATLGSDDAETRAAEDGKAVLEL